MSKTAGQALTGQADFMVSHAWSTNFVELISMIHVHVSMFYKKK